MMTETLWALLCSQLGGEEQAYTELKRGVLARCSRKMAARALDGKTPFSMQEDEDVFHEAILVMQKINSPKLTTSEAMGRAFKVLENMFRLWYAHDGNITHKVSKEKYSNCKRFMFHGIDESYGSTSISSKPITRRVSVKYT